MRILVIDEALPWPTDSGKRIRTFELMRRLAASFEIVFAYHAETPTSPEARAAFEAAGIEIVAVPRRPLEKTGWRFGWDLGRNAFLSVPYMVMAHRTARMRETVGRLVADRQIDLVHAEWTPLVANVPAGLDVPVAIAAHNVESLIWWRYHENETSTARRAYVGMQARKVERFEARALRDADVVISVSEEDGERIRALGQEHVQVAPNGVDATAFAPRRDAEVVPDSLLFVGSLDWRPNLDAVAYFLDEIRTPLLKLRPDARLTIVGRHPPDWLEKRVASSAGISIAASVPDVQPYVASAAVSIVPLRIGGGSRLKICEALAMERPVVSTSVGAEGLELGDGIARADGAEAFARAVVQVLAEPAEAAAMARRGRERVLARYEWDRIAPLQADAWRDAIERGRHA